MSRPFYTVSIIAGVVFLFLWGAWQQGSQVNTNMGLTDQSAYMGYAKQLARTNMKYVGGRNRMPLYPAILSFFYSKGISDEEFFARGKAFGVAVGLLISLVAYLTFRSVCRPVDAAVATGGAMFTVLAYKAPYVQAEMLFYGISLVLFLLLLSLIKKPSFRGAVLAGLVAGVGHLTKASILLALLLAALLVVLKGPVDLLLERREGVSISRPTTAHVLYHVGCSSALLICFLIIVFPYIRTSKERFGRYFYNVNSTFYMWYHSWNEVEVGTKAHGDRLGWPGMPEEEIPSLRKYLCEHSPAQIGGRVVWGLVALRSRLIHAWGGAVQLLLIYAGSLAALFFRNRAEVRRALQGLHPCTVLFVLVYFGGYLVLYAWYVPIAGGSRFVLSLFLPSLLLMLMLISFAESRNMKVDIGGVGIRASMVSPFVLLTVMIYLLTVFDRRVFSFYGGS